MYDANKKWKETEEGKIYSIEGYYFILVSSPAQFQYYRDNSIIPSNQIHLTKSLRAHNDLIYNLTVNTILIVSV